MNIVFSAIFSMGSAPADGYAFLCYLSTHCSIRPHYESISGSDIWDLAFIYLTLFTLQ